MRGVWLSVIVLIVTGCATAPAPQSDGRNSFWVPWPEWTPVPLSLLESTENGEALIFTARSGSRPETAPATQPPPTPPVAGSTPPPPPAKPDPTPAPISELHTEYAEAGKDVKFAASADGTPPLSFQWRKDGKAIKGATTAVLAIEKAGPEHAGKYDCIVKNSAGSTVSAPFKLVVRSQ